MIKMVGKIKTLIVNDKVLMHAYYVLVSLAVVVMCSGPCALCYLTDDERKSIATIVMIVGSAVAVLLFVLGLLCRKKCSDKVEISPLAAALVMGFSSYIMPDIVMGSYFPKSSILYTLMGFLLSMSFFFLALVIPINPKILLIAFKVFFTFYAVIQYYIVYFRGNPVQFSDFFNISSALEIKSEYKFTLQNMPLIAVAELFLQIVILCTAKLGKTAPKRRIVYGAASVICIVSVVASGRYCFELGIRNRYIRLGFSDREVTNSYKQVGFNLMFLYDGLYNRVEKPEGYTDEKGRAFVEIKNKPEQPEKKPVIIGILNESFADFRHIADFKMSDEVMPNYMALKNEAKTGFVSVSAYGGYSCNSEYEFLTGNTMAFLPPGSAAFTQYLDEKQWGLVTWLKELGYRTKAVSPCSPGLWSIGSAYENLQFDEREYDCEQYMSEKHYVNGELSDSSLYKYLEEKYEEHDRSKGFFMWTATMQNHGPYDDLGYVDVKVTFEDYNNDEALQYLNSIHSADEAIGELLDYFRNVDEEVIIVFFGDHYPHIPSFSEYLYGKSLGSLSVEEYSRLRQTPFFIWDNKGMEAEELENLSLNYLSNELMETAGLPKAPYQQELDRIREKIPSISSFGYRTDDGKWHESTETADGYEDILNEFKTMQYYRIFREYKDH